MGPKYWCGEKERTGLSIQEMKWDISAVGVDQEDLKNRDAG